ncbi:MAG: hypothetical protein JOZ96_12920 [Acidobacteria bacterium]|nr:hypothetical protein [Acidobacteriota bacterium]
MRLVTLTLLLCLLAACGSPVRDANVPAPTPAAATPAAVAEVPQSKTCALLTPDDLKEVQGEAPAGAQGSEHAAGPLSMSQCFYRLPTFVRSVDLEVVRGDAGALKEYWRRHFHPEAVEARERQRELKEEREREREEALERERAAGQSREGGHGEEEEKGEEEEARPQRVRNLGEEAYATLSRDTSTLYVLKGEAVLRVSVSGPGEPAERQKRAAALAAKALRKL